MTLDLQSNIALKITFKLIFFKCSLAKNKGGKLKVSSHFSLLGGQNSGGHKQPCGDAIKSKRKAAPFNPAFTLLSLFTFLQLVCTFFINKIQKPIINIDLSFTSCPFPSPSILPIENLTWLGFPAADQLWQHPHLSSTLAYVSLAQQENYSDGHITVLSYYVATCNGLQ